MAALGLSACDSGGSSSFSIDDYTGTYRGTASTTFRSGTDDITTTAPMVVTVTKETSNTLSVSFDAGPATSGADDPAPVVFPGSYSSTGARIAFADGTNSLVITVDGSGGIDGSGNVDLFGTVLALDPSGRISGGTFALDIAVRVVTGNADVPTGSAGRITVDASRRS